MEMWSEADRVALKREVFIPREAWVPNASLTGKNRLSHYAPLDDQFLGLLVEVGALDSRGLVSSAPTWPGSMRCAEE